MSNKPSNDDDKPEELAVPNVSGWSEEKLLAGFFAAQQQCVEALIMQAAIYAEMLRKGIDTAQLDISRDHGLILLRIASGSVAAEIVRHTGTSLRKINIIERLPIQTQRAIADTKIPVVIGGETKEMDIAAIRLSDLDLAIGDGVLRSPAEQKAIIRKRAEKPAPEPAPAWELRKIRYCPESKCLKVGNMCVNIADVVAELAEAAGPLSVLNVDLQQATATAKLTDKEAESLEHNAKRVGIPKHHLIRLALHVYGLLGVTR